MESRHEEHCAFHPTLRAIARCQRCSSALCDECFRLVASERPVCEVCALELVGPRRSRWPFAVAFVGSAVAICAGVARFQGPDPSWGLWTITLLVALVIGVAIGASTPPPKLEKPIDLRERDLELEPAPELLQKAAHPYRARIARVVRRVVPLSGRLTALTMTAAFVASAVVLPLGLALPRWVEIELVLASWWLGVVVLTTRLLYRRLRLVEDHRLAVGALSGALKERKPDEPGAKREPRWWESTGGCDFGVTSCGEGLAVVAVLAVALGLAWLLVELVVPVLFFAFYYFVVKVIGRVARDRHDCEGNLGRSLLWGVSWATLYVAPPALMTWIVHVLVAAQ